MSIYFLHLLAFYWYFVGINFFFFCSKTLHGVPHIVLKANTDHFDKEKAKEKKKRENGSRINEERKTSEV